MLDSRTLGVVAGLGGRLAGSYWCQCPVHNAMTDPLAPSSLLTPLISSAAMRAILDDRARLQRMLDFEVALARAEAAIGVIPSARQRPDRQCRQGGALRH